MTYDTLTTAAAAEAWKRRVRTALLKAAIDITVDSPAAGLDTRRDALARQVMLEPDLWVNRFAVPVALGFLADVDLGAAAVTDSEMDTRIAGIWNDFLAPA